MSKTDRLWHYLGTLVNPASYFALVSATNKGLVGVPYTIVPLLYT